MWIVDRRGQHVGPFSTVELALAAKNGLLAENDLIWKSGLPAWFRAGEVEGLLPPAAAEGSRKPAGPFRSNLMAQYAAAIPAGPFAPVHRAAGADFRNTSEARSRTVVSADAPAANIRAAVATVAPAPASPAAHEPQAAAQSLPATQTPSDGRWTRQYAEQIAHQIVIVLERYEIKTIDDLASNERLRLLAGYTFDALPSAIRLPLSGMIGRAWVEAHVYNALAGLRSTLLTPEFLTMDLRQATLRQAPAIAATLEDAITQMAKGVGMLLATNWQSVRGAVKEIQTQIAGPAPMAVSAT